VTAAFSRQEKKLAERCESGERKEEARAETQRREGKKKNWSIEPAQCLPQVSGAHNLAASLLSSPLLLCVLASLREISFSVENVVCPRLPLFRRPEFGVALVDLLGVPVHVRQKTGLDPVFEVVRYSSRSNGSVSWLVGA
jgi:hypothetical protein